MSHEIRTPLHAVLGMSHLLQQIEQRPERRAGIAPLLAGALQQFRAAVDAARP